MQALKARRSSREFRPDPLPPQILSNLLWAGFGVNRIETGGRTAPSASNSQDLEMYLATADGVFVYEPKPHQLRQVLTDDLRALTGRQAFAKDVPMNLIYVSDLTRMTRAAPEDREFYAAAHTGFVSQNVYLYCASEGLATVVRASLDRAGLAKALNLGKEQKITLAQSVGYPKV
jgi:SagB-type dehydrogenase family enzyme